jgi:hypothetical protein
MEDPYEHNGWTVETSHPSFEGAENLCATCAQLVDPTIAWAIDWGSTAFGSMVWDENGGEHRIRVSVPAP